MIRVEFSIGLKYDREGRPLASYLNVDSALSHALEEVCKVWGGASVKCGQGSWLDADGRLVTEDNAVITVDIMGEEDDVYSKARHLASIFATTFNQSSVYLVVCPLHCIREFVSQPISSTVIPEYESPQV